MRTQTQILQKILQLTKSRIYQDRLIRKANVSPQMFRKYELALLNGQKITKQKEENRIYYKITNKGERTLKSLRHMHKVQSNILRHLNI